MAIREAQKKYNERNIKRIPLDVQKDFYDSLSAHVSKQGLTVNGYIKQAIIEKMQRDGIDIQTRKGKTIQAQLEKTDNKPETE